MMRNVAFSGISAIASAAMALLFVVGCEGPVPSSRIDVGQIQPDLALLSLWDGRPTSTRSFRGKAVLVNIWATWCVPCRSEMPNLELLSKSLDPNMTVVIGISVDRDLNLAREFLLQNYITFPNFTDADLASSESRLGEGTLPETLLIAPDGRLVARIAGVRNWTNEDVIDMLRQGTSRKISQ